ncbi:signal peptidase I [Clostridium sp. Marseille-P3244]|uniref:signal peptidase I n=1 Tax=Clostridium sp. Marseille-P3244 TaxID=1871020 RepID=UPI000931BD73|nr:signal peptidase I [Clostridium sp. Marseille-P3244]
MAQRHDKDKKSSAGRELMQWILILGIALLLGIIINSTVIVNAQIPSGSMENTIMPGDRVFGNRLSYVFGEPERFDIIIFRYPDDESQLFIKRIIGLPGETVEIRNGNIYIDGSDEPLKDVDTKEPMQGNFGPYTVPKGCYFVMGDNRNNSKDSRYWKHTFVSEDEILGKAVFRYWPLNKMKCL